MNLADKLDICKKIEIAILSDIKLSKEQKEHIENCESCKALLSQFSTMKSDLAGFSVPGIKEGQIADSVMASIKKQKTSVPFPKFRLTHHLGTAAAIAIVLVAAIIINNPSNRNGSGNISADKSGVSVTDEQDTQSTTENKLLAAKFSAPGSEKPASGGNTYAESGSPAVINGAAQATEEEQNYFRYEDYEGMGYVGNDLRKANENSEETDSVEASPEAAYTLDSAASQAVDFSDIEFGDSLEENIKLANERVFELTGKKDFFKLSDFDSNDDFLLTIELAQIY